MIIGILFTSFYILYFKFLNPDFGPEEWLWGISPEGIGTLGMLINAVVALVVSYFTPAPPQNVMDMVENIRYPKRDRVDYLEEK